MRELPPTSRMLRSWVGSVWAERSARVVAAMVSVRGGFALGVTRNEALFQVIGTTFGGNAETLFEAPDVPSPVEGFDYFMTASGIYPPW